MTATAETRTFASTKEALPVVTSPSGREFLVRRTGHAGYRYSLVAAETAGYRYAYVEHGGYFHSMQKLSNYVAFIADREGAEWDRRIAAAHRQMNRES